jgi:quercetin dioxygenase-like cupin family protein
MNKEMKMTVADVMTTAGMEVRGAVTRRLLGIDLTEVGPAGGEVAVLLGVVPAGAMVPMHTHGPEESFFVMEGEFEFGTMEGGVAVVRKAGPGEVVRVPSRVPHSFRNPGPGAGKMVIVAEGALMGFFEEASEVVAFGAPLQTRAPTEAEIERVMGVMVRHGQVLMGPHPGS